MELAFLAHERPRTRRIARIGAISGASIVSLNYLVGVTLFHDYKGYATVIAVVLSAVIAFLVTGTRAYLRQPALDIVVALLVWVVVFTDFFEYSAAFDLFRDYPRFSPYNELRVFHIFTTELFIVSVYSSMVFLGNFRNYLFYTIATTLGYELFVYALVGIEPAVKVFFLSALVIAISLFFNREREVSYRARFATAALLDIERVKTENLLYNVLPEAVALRLKSGDVVVDTYDRLAVVFVDVVGFSTLSKRISPVALLDLLNRFFLAADHCAARHGLEKVKTIGDAYLAVAGGVSSAGAGSAEAVRFGIDLIRAVAALPNTVATPFDIRVGIHTGPAIGGVIGEARLAYDYWGETMNIASRIESCAPVGGVAVSAATHADTAGEQAFDPPATITLKGVGDTTVHTLRIG